MQELSDTLRATKTQDMSVYLIIGGVILLTFVGFILFYIFLPKQGYIPGKGYVMKGGKDKIGDKIKKTLKKLSTPKRDEEKVKEKKLDEWRRIYNKKKQEYGNN
ncbi:MAG: hypothetical protein KAU95_02390, partial [Candidatus Aenigmarchaeota archaeon]|nr:hypothetical protein [Candidatus Aenigmarchaeota archaeon]